MDRGVFIAGTDTGVGKTVVSCLLAEVWRRAGRRVAVMKPYAAGGWSDTDALIRSAGGHLTRGEVTPIFYKRPLAPVVRDFDVLPAKAGIQELERLSKSLGPGFRRGDDRVDGELERIRRIFSVLKTTHDRV